MINRIHIIKCISLIIATTSISCDESIESTNNNNGIISVSFKLSGTQIDDDTRNIISYNSSTVTSSSVIATNYFINTDTIGIFPYSGDQIPFPLTNLTEPKTSFVFYGTGWDLKKDLYYYAYTPFNRRNYAINNNIEHVYINYYGQEEDTITAITNASLYLADNNMQTRYLYLCSSPSISNEKGEIQFVLYRIPGILRARLRLYKGSDVVKDARIILAKVVYDQNALIMEGSYSLKEAAELKSGDSFAAIPVTPSKRGLTNTAAVSFPVPAHVDGTGRIYLHLFMPPVEANRNARIYLYDTDYNYYVYTPTSDKSLSMKSNTITLLNANAYYAGKATLGDLEIEPWENREDTVYIK